MKKEIHKIVLEERIFETSGEMHAFLQGALRFPSYYGRNLDALSDCAEDIDDPVRITIKRDSNNAGDKPWFGKAVRVLKRAAKHNSSLEVIE